MSRTWARLACLALVVGAVGCGAAEPRAVQPTSTELVPDPTDPDYDRIRDHADRCPCVAEDPDGFEDLDGCPDLDNDGDRVPDSCDLCADVAETYNAIDDEDGCPDSGIIGVHGVQPDGESPGTIPWALRCGAVAEVHRYCEDGPTDSTGAE